MLHTMMLAISASERKDMVGVGMINKKQNTILQECGRKKNQQSTPSLREGRERERERQREREKRGRTHKEKGSVRKSSTRVRGAASGWCGAVRVERLETKQTAKQATKKKRSTTQHNSWWMTSNPHMYRSILCDGHSEQAFQQTILLSLHMRETTRTLHTRTHTPIP
jgi:hypothetical protein